MPMANYNQKQLDNMRYSVVQSPDAQYNTGTMGKQPIKALIARKRIQKTKGLMDGPMSLPRLNLSILGNNSTTNYLGSKHRSSGLGEKYNNPNFKFM